VRAQSAIRTALPMAASAFFIGPSLTETQGRTFVTFADISEHLLLNETCDTCCWLSSAPRCEERSEFGGLMSRLPAEGTWGLQAERDHQGPGLR
jgi:hypothetical protein